VIFDNRDRVGPRCGKTARTQIGNRRVGRGWQQAHARESLNNPPPKFLATSVGDEHFHLNVLSVCLQRFQAARQVLPAAD
jgi:hypothetical protein